MKLPRWLAILALCLSWWAAQPARAADLFQAVQSSYSYSFGKQITFSLVLPAGVNVQNVQVFFREKGNTNTFSGQAQLQNNTAVYTQDLSSNPLPAFHEIEFWFGFINADAKSQVTPVVSFLYEDNRFTWQTLSDAPFTVHWYTGDLKFGQMVLDVARAGLNNAQSWMDFPAPRNVNIYVYASGQDLQSSLQLAAVQLIAGHADPSLGVMVVSLPEGPAQRMETGRQVSHELMHILLYQKLGSRFNKVPTWLNEGLASNNEEQPNPDYYVVLDDAARKAALIPFNSLCNGFPTDAASFYQSYAQSQSFVRFLYQTYGRSKVEELLDLYSDGVACAKAPQDVLGLDLNTLDKHWQSEMAGVTPANPLAAVLPLLPWFFVLLIMLSAPLILSVWYPMFSKKG